MICFQPFDIEKKEMYDRFLMNCGERGCEYSFTNLFLWGRQRVSVLQGHLAFFSQFNRRSVYLFPVGTGDKKAVLDAVIQDARERGIPCRLTGLRPEDCALLESLYPGQFRFHQDRDGYDYVYDIDNLADLKGKKYQKKRNHLNRFLELYPDHRAEPITKENEQEAKALAEAWYAQREELDPTGDFQMEKAALNKALQYRRQLKMEGCLLRVNGQVIAMSLGSLLTPDTFDIHFEKALDRAEGAYAAINYYFSRYLREKYPNVRWLNREDDMGLEGLRKAKLSYRPDRMVEKSWACLLEEEYEY